MLVVIDHWEVDHRAHEAGTEPVPEIDSQEEEFPLLGELLNLRVLPGIERGQDEREDLSGREDAPKRDHANEPGNPVEIVPKDPPQAVQSVPATDRSGSSGGTGINPLATCSGPLSERCRHSNSSRRSSRGLGANPQA